MSLKSGLDGVVMKETILFHYEEEKNKECFSPLTGDFTSLTFFSPSLIYVHVLHSLDLF